MVKTKPFAGRSQSTIAFLQLGLAVDALLDMDIHEVCKADITDDERKPMLASEALTELSKAFRDLAFVAGKHERAMRTDV
ncbi:hypothetical protein [Zavarzinella formosa]|uniref:hypothetical protein n=1 Tax=Zavarzinella formosa TaxID=360055 RepID=UPI00031B4FC9|nr:hypothetical protein [Zavarzinella formosa]